MVMFIVPQTPRFDDKLDARDAIWQVSGMVVDYGRSKGLPQDWGGMPGTSCPAIR